MARIITCQKCLYGFFAYKIRIWFAWYSGEKLLDPTSGFVRDVVLWPESWRSNIEMPSLLIYAVYLWARFVCFEKTQTIFVFVLEIAVTVTKPFETNWNGVGQAISLKYHQKCAKKSCFWSLETSFWYQKRYRIHCRFLLIISTKDLVPKATLSEHFPSRK